MSVSELDCREADSRLSARSSRPSRCNEMLNRMSVWKRGRFGALHRERCAYILQQCSHSLSQLRFP